MLTAFTVVAAVALIISLGAWVAWALEQRDKAQRELVDAWFEIDRLKAGHGDVVDVPLFRPGKGTR